jgi:hypothetical protein
MWWKNCAVCLFLFLLASNCVYAQLGVGGGFELGTAAFINKAVFVESPSIGISAMVSYAPPESTLFPSVTYLLRNTVVPVENDIYLKQRGIVTSQNFVLNLNYRTTDESNYYLLFWGIGIAKMRPETDLSDRLGNAITLIDSLPSTHLYPMIQAGCKYMHRILGNSSFYVGFEANIKYIRMHADNVYYIQQGSTFTKATITGDIVTPGVQVQLAYFFDGKEE